MAQFVALEFFFRGFILQGLRVPMGSSAIAVMVVSYTMIHLPKLWPEAMGAILFGVLLGVLAIRSRSILGGLAIHASVALTLDISGVIHISHLQQYGFHNSLIWRQALDTPPKLHGSFGDSMIRDVE